MLYIISLVVSMAMILLMTASTGQAVEVPISDIGSEEESTNITITLVHLQPTTEHLGISQPFTHKPVAARSKSDFDIDQLQTFIANYSDADLDELYASLGVKTKQELYATLGWPFDETKLSELEIAKMHVKSYEQGLMQYAEFRAHKYLLLYIPPILILIGTFGNVISFIILRR